MDAVEELFEALPDPNCDHRTITQNGDIDMRCYATAIDNFLKSDSEDPDYQFLLSAAKIFFTNPCGNLIFQQHIGKLALSKAAPYSVVSQKDRQLQYYRWIAQGRKDEDCPLSRQLGTPVQRAKHGDVEQRALFPFQTRARPHRAPAGLGHELLHGPRKIRGTPLEGGVDIGIDAPEMRPQTDTATHAYLTDESSKACSNCGKGPDNLTWCSACPVKVPNRMITCTFYCGKQCQEQHWPSHKKLCAARKKLWRAVQLIQALHIKFQSNTFAPVLEELIVRNGILYCADRPKVECVVTGRSKTSTLTRDQAPSEEIFLAAIMANKCPDITRVFKPTLDTLLKPLGLLIEEICVIPRNIHRPTCNTFGNIDWEDHIAFSTHFLLRITLPNGEQMAVDFSSPQMGWHETLAPWTVWRKNRALFVYPPRRYGSLNHNKWVNIMEMDSERDEVENRRKQLVVVMNSTIQDLMARENIAKATKLFSLDKPRYECFANTLLSSVEESLAEDIQRYTQSRVGLQYYDDAWKVCWTLNEAQAAALDDVWLTEAEVQSCGGNESRLKQIWASRCRGSQKQNQFKALGMCMQFN